MMVVMMMMVVAMVRQKDMDSTLLFKLYFGLLIVMPARLWRPNCIHNLIEMDIHDMSTYIDIGKTRDKLWVGIGHQYHVYNIRNETEMLPNQTTQLIQFWMDCLDVTLKGLHKINCCKNRWLGWTKYGMGAPFSPGSCTFFFLKRFAVGSIWNFPPGVKYCYQLEVRLKWGLEALDKARLTGFQIKEIQQLGNNEIHKVCEKCRFVGPNRLLHGPQPVQNGKEKNRTECNE